MSKRRGREEREARPAVVTITCPSCGGSVRGADLGERSTCTYCGTELHVPDVELRAEEERAAPRSEEPAPESSAPAPPARPNTLPHIVIALTGLAGLCVFIVLRVRAASEPGPPPPAIVTPTPTRDTDDIVANAECTVACNGPCLEIKDPSSMMQCMDGCEDKCKFVGKGTRTQCMGRCGSKCVGAPDPGSRAACESGCTSECPPN